MEPVCFLNGDIIRLTDAKVGILDLGILRGFGVYEGLTAFDGEPFHFDDHWQRFENAARALDLTIPYSAEEVLSAMRTIIAHNAPGVRANLRMILTGGEARHGIEAVPGNETFFITAEPHVPLPPAIYEHGGHITTHNHQRYMPEIKTTHYITAVTLQKKRVEARAVDILYTSNGHALECATGNIFIVKNGILYTPKEHVLPGITRKLVLTLINNVYPARERAISISELRDADEVCITGSFKDIVPIVSIDDKTIGSGKPGPITRDIMGRFHRYTHSL